MKNSIILRRAKQVILEDGWTQGIGGMAVTGPACLLGAIGRAAGIKHEVNGSATYIPMEKANEHPAAIALRKCIWSASPRLAYSDNAVWRYNDLDMTTEEQALQLLNDCANNEEEFGR